MDLGSDEATLRLFLRGDESASRLIEKWAREIVGFKSYGMSPDEQDDAVQDTLVGLWRAVSAPDFKLRHGLKAIIRRIAVARCVDRLRRRRPTVELSEALEDETPSPYENLLRREKTARLAWALQSISEKCRDIIVKHFYEQIPYKKLAEQEQRAESTLRVRVFDCLKRVRALTERWA